MNRLFNILFIFCLSLFTLNAATFNAHNVSDFNYALTHAVGGDTIVLDAGTTYTGNFQLPYHGGSWVTIISSNHSSITGGSFFQRVSSSDASNMPKIQTPDANPAIYVDGAYPNPPAFWNLVGLEIAGNNSYYVQDLIRIGNGSETSSASLPQQFIINQCYIHTGTANGKRAIAANGEGLFVINNYFPDGFRSYSQDTQLISGWNGGSVVSVINNYLEGTTETLATGGATPANTGNIPSNWVVMGNTFYKNPSTYGWGGYCGKNFFETKFGRLIVIHGNSFDGSYTQDSGVCNGGQKGFSILASTRSESGSVYWATNTDIGITNNVMVHTDSGIAFTGTDPGYSVHGYGYFAYGNYLSGLTTNGSYPGVGRAFQITGGSDYVELDHNTAVDNPDYPVVFESGYTYPHFKYTNNIAKYSGGIAGSGYTDGSGVLGGYVTSSLVYDKDIFIGSTGSTYPSGTTFVGSLGSLGLSGNPFTQTGTPYYNATDPAYHVGSYTDAPYITINRYVMLVNRSTGMCLSPSTTSSGATMTQYPCYYGLSQMWYIDWDPVGSAGWRITNRYTGYALERDTGSRVDSKAWTGSSTQVWQLPNSSNWQFFHLYPNSDYSNCLTITNNSALYSAPTSLAGSCSVESPGEWAVVPVPAQIVTFGIPDTQP